MQDNSWGQALAELLQSMADAWLRFWKQDMVQVFLTLGMFLGLALPLLIVLLILWYLDHIGWRPSPGFYTIGLAQPALQAPPTLPVLTARAPQPATTGTSLRLPVKGVS